MLLNLHHVDTVKGKGYENLYNICAKLIKTQLAW